MKNSLATLNMCSTDDGDGTDGDWRKRNPSDAIASGISEEWDSMSTEGIVA